MGPGSSGCLVFGVGGVGLGIAALGSYVFFLIVFIDVLDG